MESSFVGYTPVYTAQEESKPNMVMILAIAIPGGLSNYLLEV